MTPSHTAILAMRKNLRAKYQGHADLAMIPMMLESRINSLVMADIDAVIDSWTAEQLADGLEGCHEAEKMEAASEGGEH